MIHVIGNIMCMKSIVDNYGISQHNEVGVNSNSLK